MKKYFSLFLAFLMCFMILPVNAVSEEVYRKTEIIHTGDGDIEVETILTIHKSLLRAKSRTATKSQTYKSDGTTIANVSFTATFQYDGSTVSVTDTDSSYSTYDGWSYKSENITTSGGTAKLSAKLTKTSYAGVAANISIKCTANGAIS